MNSKRLKYSIIVMVVLLMVMVFPMDVIREDVECVSGGDIAYAITNPLSKDVAVTQIFAAQHGYLNTLSIAFAIDDDASKDGEIVFELQDETGALVTQKLIPLKEVEDCIYYDIEIKEHLKKGEIYQIVLLLSGCNENVPAVYYTTHESQHTLGNVLLQEGEQIVAGQAVTRYKYEGRISFGNVLCLWLFFIGMGCVIYEWMERNTEQ